MNRIFLVMILLITISCKSQTNIIDIVNRCANPHYNTKNGSVYLKDISNIYTPYIGTWKWAEGNKEMVLTLLKQTKYHVNTYVNNNYYEDRLVGYYTYKENGVTLIDTSGENLLQDYINVNFSILCDSTISSFLFKDVYRGTSYEVTLEKLSSTQLKFTGKIGENTYDHSRTGTIYYQSGTTFPLDMVFTKQ
ncbi:DUF6705 family protein [Chryseobacterium taihuense]|uniref:DUF6705 domain-containing protein n=1 Tax=Chryseobacterium taihuense TaxID=1141221 RepID=A0ABY0R2T1_9FLAO|nr:DUF6705 family protein [Chryseobacterium taihuense]SDM33863.1 hypothetical protein SAMN05216273_1245 [Chryseobacterium taihuense]